MKGHKELRLVKLRARQSDKDLFARMRKYNTLSSRRSRRSQSSDGIHIFHVYPTVETKGYWDDFSFTHRGIYFNCAWIHPRKKYSDLIEEEASRLASLRTALSHKKIRRKRNEGAVKFKKLGRSRKKATLFSMNSVFGEDSGWDQWLADTRRFENELRSSGTLLVPCIENEISIEIQRYGFFVSMVLNKEIVDERSIRETIREMRDSMDRDGYSGLYSWINGYPTFTCEDILMDLGVDMT